MPALPPLDAHSALFHASVSARSLASHLSSLLPRSHTPSSHRQQTQSAAHDLVRRQYTTKIIPTVYQIDGPAPGTVVGIVLGSVAGFLLLIWLIYSLTNTGGNNTVETDDYVVRRRSRSPRSRRSHRSHRTTEVREISRSPRRERIIVEERRTEVPPPRPRSRSVIVEETIERRVDGDDIVEVIEEHSDVGPPPPRRKASRRTSGGAYRSVDPERYAGGDYPQHRIRH